MQRYDSSYSTIGGGQENYILDGVFDTISGGKQNFIYGYASTVIGGEGNNIHGDYGFMASGSFSTMGGKVLMGEFNDEEGVSSYAVLVGGEDTTASGNVDGKPNMVGDHASVGVCKSCYAEGTYPTLFAGEGNKVKSTNMGTILGGYYNTARGNYATVVGGARNKAFSNFATVLGGYKNKANGRFSTVIGGSSNTINGRYSTAFGYKARITADLAAVFSLQTDPCEVTTDNTFAICAEKVTLNDDSITDLIANNNRMLKEHISLKEQLTDINTVEYSPKYISFRSCKVAGNMQS